jgi:hypothetical protein
MKKFLYVLALGVLVFLLAGCGGGGGGGGGTQAPTVTFNALVQTDTPGVASGSFTATSLMSTSSYHGIPNNVLIEASNGAVEIDLAFLGDLSERRGEWEGKGYDYIYHYIACYNDPTWGNVGTIYLSNIQISADRISGSFEFETSSCVISSGTPGSITPYLLKVSGSFDIPIGGWVYSNGQWQKIQWQQIAKQK